MLIVTDRQMDALRHASLRHYLDSLLAHLTVLYPDESEGLETYQLERMVCWAARYGITRRYDLQRLAELLVEHDVALHSLPATGPLAAFFARRYPSGTALLDDAVLGTLSAGTSTDADPRRGA